jgi:hypothetical protein
LLGLLVLAAPASRAGTVNLSTGLDASDTDILVGNTPDAHWTVDQPAGGIAAALVVAPGNAGAAFPIWAANGPASSWVTIDPNSVGNGSVIPYTYYRTFTLTAADLATAAISGTWGIDDSGDLRLNGNLISTLLNDYSATTPFSVTTGSSLFQLGNNTLTITMTSSDNALEAVRLEGALTGVAVPLPAGAWLFSSALGLLGFAKRRPELR